MSQPRGGRQRERDTGVGERGPQDVTSRQRHRWNKLKASFSLGKQKYPANLSGV